VSPSGTAFSADLGGSSKYSKGKKQFFFFFFFTYSKKKRKEDVKGEGSGRGEKFFFLIFPPSPPLIKTL
jgi:hypothetical protein